MHKNSKNPEQTGLSVEPLKCSMCEKVFPRLSHLQRHQMTHLNVRSFSCEFCDEKFIQKVHLTKHVTRKHAEEAKIEVKWTACDKCGHLFKTSDEMKVHRRTVHELHRCKRCKEVIEAGNDGLRQHHIRCRNRKNICDHCGASFDRPADLFSHQMSCLKKVQFVCKQCDSYFKQRVEFSVGSSL
uniref:ArsA_HSP20 domain-containing protein n=2 Tax=Caenorhabditis tropicalis TaxID=1561998 RepID=A0A1I7UCR3_9PELO